MNLSNCFLKMKKAEIPFEYVLKDVNFGTKRT